MMWCFGGIEVCLDPVVRCRASGARVWDLHFLRKKGGVRGGSSLGLGICFHAEVFRPLTAEAFPVKA